MFLMKTEIMMRLERLIMHRAFGMSIPPEKALFPLKVMIILYHISYMVIL